MNLELSYEYDNPQEIWNVRALSELLLGKDAHKNGNATLTGDVYCRDLHFYRRGIVSYCCERLCEHFLWFWSTVDGERSDSTPIVQTVTVVNYGVFRFCDVFILDYRTVVIPHTLLVLLRPYMSWHHSLLPIMHYSAMSRSYHCAQYLFFNSAWFKIVTILRF